MFAHEKLPGLPRQRLLDAIEPVLRAHGLVGVEIVWRTDGQGRVLYLTLESAGAAEPGVAAGAEGVTLEVCSRVSRDLSTAFDVLELFDGNYRLEVGSPGLDRRLYTLADYQRFQGKLAKLKLASPIAGQAVLTGRLAGVDAEGRVLLAPADAPGSEPPASPQAIVRSDPFGATRRRLARDGVFTAASRGAHGARASASRPTLGCARSPVSAATTRGRE